MRYTDRKGWPSGPWDTEPDHEIWTDENTGYVCAIRRVSGGALAGYIAVPAGHPWHGADYDNACEHPDDNGVWLGVSPGWRMVSVHGGLTYSGSSWRDSERDGAGTGLFSDADPDVWWFGFDCAHAFDLRPGDMALYRPAVGASDVYRDWAYVKANVLGLAAAAAYGAAVALFEAGDRSAETVFVLDGMSLADARVAAALIAEVPA